MKLYYAPGACSMAPHIALREAGLSFELEKVDLTNKQTAKGVDYASINPKGYVPALRLDSGEILTEVAVILQFLADQKPESKLAPPCGTLERYRLMEWLNFISSEIHKQFSPLFNPKINPEWRDHQVALLGRRFTFISDSIGRNPYLLGEQFSVADAYLFTMLRWCELLHVNLGRWPKLEGYLARVANRPAVKEALNAEGLEE